MFYIFAKLSLFYCIDKQSYKLMIIILNNTVSALGPSIVNISVSFPFAPSVLARSVRMYFFFVFFAGHCSGPPRLKLFALILATKLILNRI